jgi:hypothetical protein
VLVSTPLDEAGAAGLMGCARAGAPACFSPFRFRLRGLEERRRERGLATKSGTSPNSDGMRSPAQSAMSVEPSSSERELSGSSRLTSGPAAVSGVRVAVGAPAAADEVLLVDVGDGAAVMPLATVLDGARAGSAGQPPRATASAITALAECECAGLPRAEGDAPLPARFVHTHAELCV